MKKNNFAHLENDTIIVEGTRGMAFLCVVPAHNHHALYSKIGYKIKRVH